MDSNWLCLSIVTFWLWSSHVHCQTTSFVVDNFGAVPNGKTDSKQGFLNAWKKACATNGGTLVIPKGSTYLVSDAEFSGPCNGQTKVSLFGTLIAPLAPTPNLDYWIKFTRLSTLSISGNGILNGNGASFWKSRGSSTTIISLKLQFVDNASVKDITSINSKKFHFGLNNCNGVSIDNVHITAPGDSPNTDGIHVGVSDNIRITNSYIATGDDCISMGAGTTNINITGVTCGPGHGISIGSLGKYPAEKEVRFVRVTNCTFTQTLNGVRIKTFGTNSTSGLASDITFNHIVMNNVYNPIIIDQHYCSNRCADQDEEDMIMEENIEVVNESNVSIQRVKFMDVRGSSNQATGVVISCSKTKPCQDIELSGVKLTFQGRPTTATCSSADVRFLGPVQIPSRCS